MIFAPPPEPGPFVGSSLALTNHWKPTGCASAGFAPLIRMRSACLMSRQWFVMAPRPKVAAKLTTVGPCQTRACCSMCTMPSVRIAFDLEELGLSVDLFRVRDERAPDRAIGTDRMNFLRAGDAKLERSLLRGGDIEPERIGNGNERHAGGAGGSELQEFTSRDFL